MNTFKQIIFYTTLTLAISLATSKKYYVQTQTKENWYAAAETCASLGYQLATVNSASEESDIEAALAASSNPNDFMWISGTNLAQPSPSVYEWFSSGAAFTYTNWGAGEPNNFGGNEHCVHLWPVAGGRPYWNDLDCADTNFFIFEDKICKNNGNECNNQDGNDCKKGGLVTNLLGDLL